MSNVERNGKLLVLVFPVIPQGSDRVLWNNSWCSFGSFLTPSLLVTLHPSQYRPSHVVFPSSRWRSASCVIIIILFVLMYISCIYGVKGILCNHVYVRDRFYQNMIISHKYFIWYFCFANMCMTWVLSAQQEPKLDIQLFVPFVVTFIRD